MSKVDYSSLINEDEENIVVQETPQAFGLTRAVNWTGWGTQTGHSDDRVSVVDKKKNIKVNDEQINVTQENRAQFIPFEMDRFYDGIDFAWKAISIHYERADGTAQSSPAVNAQFSEDKIRFGWLLDEAATAVAGPLSFEVHVSGAGPDGQEFLWKSQPIKEQLSVIQSLNPGEPIVIDASWQEQLVTAFMEAFKEENLDAFAKKTDVENAINEISKDDIDSVDLSVDSSNYQVVLTLNKKDGTTLTDTIDLPLESVVVDGSYDNTSKKVTLTLQNGNTIEIDVADLVDGLASETYVDTQIQAAKDYADTAVANADIEGKLTNYATKTYVDEAIENADIDGKLTDYATKTYVDEAIENADIDGKLTEYAKTTEVTSAINTAKLEAITHTNNKLGVLQREEGVDLTVKEYVDSIDISSRLGDLGENITTDEETGEEIRTPKTVEEFVTDKVGDIGESQTVVEYITKAIDEVDVSEQLGNLGENADGTGKTVKQYVDEQTSIVKNDVETLQTGVTGNATNINTLSQTVGNLQSVVNGIDKSPRLTYTAVYNDLEDENSGENKFVLYEISDESGEHEERTVKASFTITGGGGGGGGATLKIGYITTSPLIVTPSDKAIIKFSFSGVDSSGDAITEATSTWKTGGQVIGTGTVYEGENEFDVTDFISIGDGQKVVLEVKDEGGNSTTKTWTVKKIDVRIESTFNDKTVFPMGPVSFTYTPWGQISKTIHFVLDGKEIGQVTNEINGVPQSFTIPAQTHGAHLFEAYITATVNNNNITSSKIVRDIIWYDSANETSPVIGAVQQEFNARQYETVELTYYVYDPENELPQVALSASYLDPIRNQVITEYSETITLGQPTNIWNFKPSVYFDPADENISDEADLTKLNKHTLTITCRGTTKYLTATVSPLGISIAPITADLAFDFNPAGRSNDSADRLWQQGDYKMTVSPNFDWINGGYKQETDMAGKNIPGTEHFCVKAGTWADIDYKLFANDPRADGTGKAFKFVFKTRNIKKRDTVFMTCLEGTGDDRIGLEMKIENGTIYASGAKLALRSDFSEEDIIEYEFVINPQDVMPIVMAYEDGTPCRALEYSQGDTGTNFKQTSPKTIKIGSSDCDVLIYRMKAYTKALNDQGVLNNFIADARDIEDMISRYERNQIYDSNLNLITTTANGGFNADALMKAAPNLHYIFLDTPRFTNDKDDKVKGGTVYHRYPAGKRPEDNWKCVNVTHRGQGTSSNEYGYAGRNIDLVMDNDDSLFTWTDETGATIESKTVAMSEGSVPTDYLNIKVNIASSENANNAELARMYNQYMPFLRYASKKDSRVKDTMEFFNCVVFIRESSTDETNYPHQEFKDTNWHFYAIGNVGDSKKTDDTRVNNKKDPKEFVLEITDVDKALCGFPTGKDNQAICPPDEWKEGNSAYDILYSQEYIYDKDDSTKFESFGAATYEFRYEMKKLTDEQREDNINAWRQFYSFVVTATDEEFYNHLKDYFVVDSAIYFYLFTERYTMVDNRAKNTFWHYGKVYISETEAESLGETEASYYIIDNAAAAINDGYRFDLNFGYDMDTALGIDNTGDYVFSYGKEDTDVYNGDQPVFRVANSTFFCRLRDLFPAEMQAMYRSREANNAWNADTLIKTWDDSQNKFPEELWRLDYQRKYYRTYAAESIDNSIVPLEQGRPKKDSDFLLNKFFGRKRYARRSFETNQAPFFGSKYFAQSVLNSRIWIRGSFPTNTPNWLKPNYSLTLTPYQDMYLCVQYTSSGNPQHSVDANGKKKRIKAGETYVFQQADATVGMDFIYIFGANRIQAIGDLSRCYVGSNSFADASRLQKLEIGNQAEGYQNSFLNNIELNNSPLLEYLDLSNVTGFDTQLELGNCFNLKEFYAQGSTIPGVRFATQGALEIAKLPDLSTIEAKNLYNIKTFELAGTDNLSRIVIEDCPGIDVKTLLENAKEEKLALVRVSNFDWELPNGTGEDSKEVPLLNKLYNVEFRDGIADKDTVLSGSVYAPIIRSKKREDYLNLWPKLTINQGSIQSQFTVTFVNEDGTILDVQYVDQGQDGENPITRAENPIAVPTKESSISTVYTFSHWLDKAYNKEDEEGWENVQRNITMTAQYTESTRKYTVKFINPKLPESQRVLQTTEELYGEVATYQQPELPSYKGEEGAYKYYLFSGWNKSGYVDGDKTIEAQFDSASYQAGVFDGKKLSELSNVELYMLTRLIGSDAFDTSTLQTMFEVTAEEEAAGQTPLFGDDKVVIKMGEDVDYDDIESEVLLENQIFDGKKQIDTGKAIMDTDKDFVIAIDYEFASDNFSDYTLVDCYDVQNYTGFRLSHGSGDQLTWANHSVSGSNFHGQFTTGSATPRQMVVIRHKAGEYGAHVYSSNVRGSNIQYIELNGTHEAKHASTLVFGAQRILSEGNVRYTNKAKGTIHWCKIWYKDLGDQVCRNLATWPHESMNFTVCLELSRVPKYYSTPTGASSLTFLADNALPQAMIMNPFNTSVGGWAGPDGKGTEVYKFLQDRVYNSFTTQQRQLLKQANVPSSKGNNSTEIGIMPSYLFIPAIAELVSSIDSIPYGSEGTIINRFVTTEDRICTLPNGTAVNYWTRSPYLYESTGYYWYTITARGEASSFNSANAGSTYVRPMFTI